MYALLPTLPGRKRGRGEAEGTSLEHQEGATQAGRVVAEAEPTAEHSRGTSSVLSSAVHEKERDISGASLEHSPPAKRRKSNRLAEIDHSLKSP
jgi:hypothetical protein